AQGFFGFSEKEVLGMNLEDTISPGDKSARVELALLIDTLRQKPEEHLIRESENTLKYGKTVWIVWTYKPTFDNQGNFKEILCIGNDITQNKRSEKETRILQDQLQRAQKMEALGTLAGGVAHDLNNILSGIISYPELLLMDLSEDSALRKPILTIKNSGERAAAIVSDLLTMARGAIAITEVVNLNGVLHEYLKSPEHARLRSDNPRIEFETRLDATLLNVLGSPVHLSKVVMNLINNAAEAMPDGGRALIATENQYVDRPMKGYDFVRAGDYSTLSVTDTGIGISPKDLERIFEPFYTRKVMGKSGTGLGLAVIWGTVKDHNGYIEVQSKVGEGTIFTLFFPVTREVLSEEKMVTSMKKYEGHGETILIVDDMPEQREIASEMLKKLGYLVASAPSGEEALDYLRKNSADLIVLDMIMGPGMDGLETYKRIVELIPGQKAIIASGFSETKRVKEAQKIGVGAYVKKPYLLEKIGMAVRRELDQ
ncbi:MAG: response regulator, partial [Thermodesulfobacteriota bacterium]|nr:response regulator [Thermodesulfobacteriota bacterium]